MCFSFFFKMNVICPLAYCVMVDNVDSDHWLYATFLQGIKVPYIGYSNTH